MNTFELTIIACNKVVYSGSAVHCRVRTAEGACGLEARHEPLLSLLTENSAISYKNTDGTEQTLTIETGLLSFQNNSCTITVSLPAERPHSPAE